MAGYFWNNFATGEPYPNTMPRSSKSKTTGSNWYIPGTPHDDWNAPRDLNPNEPQFPAGYTPPSTPATTTTTTTNPVTPAATEATWAGLLPQYYAGLKSFVGVPETWYAGRGGEKQAQTDYYNLLNAWSQRAGVPLTPDDWGSLWSSINAYKTGYQAQNPTRAFTMSNAFNYLNRMLASAPQAPNVSFLRTGEI